MNSIRVACTGCGAHYTVKAESIGKQATCNKCGQRFVVAPTDLPGGAPSVSTGNNDLSACSYCGFQDNGTFCSNCGGRLGGTRFDRVAEATIPEDYLEGLVASAAGLKEDDPKLAALTQAHDACIALNERITRLIEAARAKAFDEATHWFGRADIRILLDLVPASLPNAAKIKAALWATVTDVERWEENERSTSEEQENAKQAEEEIQQCLTSLQTSIAAGEHAVAGHYLAEYRELLSLYKPKSPPCPVSELEAQVTALKAGAEQQKAAGKYAKVSDKAEKLQFVGDHKKAVKAWQECLFWLSKNDHPDKAAMESKAKAALAECEAKTTKKPSANR